MTEYISVDVVTGHLKMNSVEIWSKFVRLVSLPTKPLRKHYTRKWDMQTAPSICPHCGLGCNTIVGERYGSVRRILNRYNHEVNGYFLCDRGRFGYEFVNSHHRVRQSLVDMRLKSRKHPRWNPSKRKRS